MAGEAFLLSGECRLCEAGTYLLSAPSSPTICSSCPANAVCLGGNEIGPAAGYWRETAESLNFFACFNPPACLGTLAGASFSPSGLCHSNYLGVLCAQCQPNFSRNSLFECEQCPEAWKNVVLILFLTLLLSGVIVIMVRVTLTSSTAPKSLLSVFLKIMLSHLQMLSLVGALELNWPSEVSAFIKESGVVA